VNAAGGRLERVSSLLTLWIRGVSNPPPIRTPDTMRPYRNALLWRLLATNSIDEQEISLERRECFFVELFTVTSTILSSEARGLERGATRPRESKKG
jgi:hypothetical protein